MASTRRRHNSSVADLINFEASETAPWRRNTKVPTVPDMIKEIVQCKRQWDSTERDSLDSRRVDEIMKTFRWKFIYHCCFEEDHGLGTLEATTTLLDTDETTPRSGMSREEEETFNVDSAYSEIIKFKEGEDADDHGLIEESMLRKLNQTILKLLSPINRPITKPGFYSDQRRITTFEKEHYEYQHPADMQNAVNTLLDRFNNLYLHEVKAETDKEEQLHKLFRTCSWFVFELLDLHPFADGNGRMCRLLCSYIVSVFAPFPTSIYNIWSESSKDDYNRALVAARTDINRRPTSLTTMIVECNWFAWREFLADYSSGSQE